MSTDTRTGALAKCNKLICHITLYMPADVCECTADLPIEKNTKKSKQISR